MRRVQVGKQPCLEVCDPAGRDVLQQPMHHRIQDHDLLFHGQRLVLRLFEHLDNAFALRQACPRISVQVGAKLGKRLQLPVL